MSEFEERISEIRAFNRFYTRHVGDLNEGLLESSFSLAETRLLYELAHHDHLTSTDLVRELRLDPGYISRLLKSFRDRGLAETTPAPEDGRKALIRLTESGRAAFAPLNARSRDEVAGYLGPMSESDQRRLVAAMATIRSVLDPVAPTVPTHLIRPHRPGDIGWVIHRHAVLYQEEYQWDGSFETLVAEIGAAFLKNFNPKDDCCWIAERDGFIAGSVFVVRADETTAKLRLLYVEPSARGSGLGRRLVEEAMRFARGAGYLRMTLWTNDVLTAARTIYQSCGFDLVDSTPHHSFGNDLVAQTWERDL